MSRYVWTFVALLLLTGLTLGLSFLHLGPWGIAAALAIAAAKAALIALFFMHLTEENATVQVAVVVGLLLAATLMVLSVVDVETRPEPPDQPPRSALSRASESRPR